MLKKLFKYDFQALSKRLWPIQIAVVGGSLLAGACLAYDLAQAEKVITVASNSGVMDFIINMVMVLILVAIAASALITLLLTCTYFNRSLLGDEGYLSFTLPVRTSELLWSKIWVGFVWSIINLIAVMLGMLLFLGVGCIPMYSDASFLEGMQEALEALRQIGPMLAAELPGFSLPLFLFLCTVCAIVSHLSSLIMIYFAITAAFQVSNRHRVLVTVGLLFAITTAMGILSSLVSFSLSTSLITLAASELAPEFEKLYTALLLETLLAGGAGAGLYCWMQHLMEKKLNLE